MTHPLSLNTHAEQIAHYKAVKNRINNAKFRPAPQPPVITYDRSHNRQSFEWTRRPMWMREDINFDEHVMVHRRVMATAPHIRWLRMRCREIGVDYDEVIGAKRTSDIVAARFQLIWEMRNKFDVSFPQIGRAFGNRDHSSAHNAYYRYQETLVDSSDTATGN